MNQSSAAIAGEKVLIGILAAVVVGVGAQLAGRDAESIASMPTQVASVAVALAPITDDAMSVQAREVATAMLGMWQNSEDPKFKLEFQSNGIVVDRYDGGDLTSKRGIWGVFTTDMAGGDVPDLVPGFVYLQMTIGGEGRNFRVIRASDTLDLMYLDNGSRLRFTR